MKRQKDAQAVFLIRDQDDQPERRKGLEQARDEHRSRAAGITVVVGLAIPKRESWVLCGFDPENDVERKHHSELKQKLGFDPCCKAHKLTAKHDHHKKSAKRVLAKLTSSNIERETKCWQETSLETLEKRGVETGLTEFIREIREQLLSKTTTRQP